jgi:hypothetical protein
MPLLRNCDKGVYPVIVSGLPLSAQLRLLTFAGATPGGRLMPLGRAPFTNAAYCDKRPSSRGAGSCPIIMLS